MSISDSVKRLLCYSSAWFCQNPSCSVELVKFFEGWSIVQIQEFAHIIWQSEMWPRWASILSKTERDEYDNIIVLCPNCHSMVDKKPSEFPGNLLRSWKKDHEERIRSLFEGTEKHLSRESLRKRIKFLLDENRGVFMQYWPISEWWENPIRDVKPWRKYVFNTIIPNNRNICKLLYQNSKLIESSENHIVCAFRLHAEAFEYNHLSWDKQEDAPVFPQEINHILQ